ncbi:MAG: IS110 family transposase [Candidatus Methanoperedens sp.]|nr:IS110 family transposase [Candidatus Methanoperedens sp.]
MNIRVEKSCGIDVHKAFLSATILTQTGIKDTREFSTSLEGLLDLRNWIVENDCQRVAIESTGIYWIPTYTMLEGKVETIVANPLQIKYIPGRKTDDLDSEWIAEVCLNGQIKPSYVPCREIRDIRELTRTHVKLNQAITAFKNRVHKILQRAGIRISVVLSDIFGKSGTIILNGILDGKSIEQIFGELKSKRIKATEAEIKEAIKGELSQSDIFVVKECLETIGFLNTKLKEVDSRTLQSLTGMKKEMEILMSINGIGFTTAAGVLAEIGNITVFPKPKSLVSWSGLAPAVNESAGKSSNSHITKRGNKYLRTFLVLAANSIAIGKPNKLRFFYQRLQAKKGRKKAIVALARKLACIVHHLLTNNEKYSEEEMKEKKIKLPKLIPMQDLDFEEMIGILCEAGYTVNKSSVAG